MAAIKASGVAVGMPDWPAAAPQVLVPVLDVVGDSHISEFGPSSPAFGIAQKVADALGAIVRSCALGGATHSWADQGNGTIGDGGHMHVANEYDRQEQSGNKYNSTITASPGSGVSSITVTSVTNGATPVVGEWVVLGQGANTEVIQISQTWNGASPMTFVTPTTKAHTTGDPIYHAVRNEGGLLAKSQVVLACIEGGNDLGVTGPGAPPTPLSNTWQQGTFGTTLGASRGHTGFMHALRFTFANLRAAAIYKDTHSSIVYAGGAWTSTAQTSTKSYPPLSAFGGNAGNVHTATVAGSTFSFSTDSDFPGGEVAVFTRSGASGEGAIWDYSVSGATTVAMTAHAAGTLYDDRNIGSLYQNMASAVGTLTTGSCFLIQGLAAGVNTITVKATTIGTIATFLGYSITATIPPLILAMLEARVPGSSGLAGPGAGYNTRPRAATGATVTAGHGAAAGEVTFTGGTVALAAIGTPGNTAAEINDTITLDKGNPALEETRRIVGFTGSPATACQVDANFVNAHTASAMVIGLQDADYVGGGYLNTADTQGATSVPGCGAVIASVCSEFDDSVVPVPTDLIINTRSTVNPNGNAFYTDGVHFNDGASALIAAEFVRVFWSKLSAIPIPRQVSPSVPNKRTFYAIYGDASATPAANTPAVQAFVNSWTNVYSSTFAGPGPVTNYAKTGYYLNLEDRRVTVRGATLGNVGTNTIIFTLPQGCRPSGNTPIAAYSVTTASVYSAASVMVDAAGAVRCLSTIVATSALVFAGDFPAEG